MSNLSVSLIVPPLLTSSPSLCSSTALPFLHLFIPPSVLSLSPIPQSSSCSSSFSPSPAFMLSSHSLPFHSIPTPPTHLSPLFFLSFSVAPFVFLHLSILLLHLLTSLPALASSFIRPFCPFSFDSSASSPLFDLSSSCWNLCDVAARLFVLAFLQHADGER